MPENPTTDLAAGRFRALTGLSDRALRLYAERGILPPTAVDPATGYRSYGVHQLQDGIALDLLRRAKVPLEDLHPHERFRFEDHRAKRAMLRAVEDFSLDLAERVAQGDPGALIEHVSDVGPAHWVACEVPLDVSSSPEDLEETFTAMAVDLPRLDRILVQALQAERIEPVAESWTAAAQGAAPRMLLAHRVEHLPTQEQLRGVADAVASSAEGVVRVTSGTLPARRELVHSSADGVPADDTGLADTALSFLSAVAFARRTAEEGVDALHDTARRRMRSTSLFDPSAAPEDVYDLTAGSRWRMSSCD